MPAIWLINVTPEVPVKYVLMNVFALALSVAAQAAPSSLIVSGHISKGQIDGSTVEVPCSVTFGSGRFSVQSAGQSSRSCSTGEGNSCQLMNTGADTFAIVFDAGKVFVCQIPSAKVP